MKFHIVHEPDRFGYGEFWIVKDDGGNRWSFQTIKEAGDALVSLTQSRES